MVKEEMVKYHGTPLFPERRAYTVNYKLSDIEAALHETVTHYVQTEMGKADPLGCAHAKARSALPSPPSSAASRQARRPYSNRSNDGRNVSNAASARKDWAFAGNKS